MVVLGTKPEYFNAVWVKNEWSRFLSLIKNGEKKILIPAYKDMDPYNLPKEFSHLQAQDMSKLGFMQDLLRGIKKILGRDKKPAAPIAERVIVQSEGHAQDAAPLLRRAFIFLEDGEFDSADEYAEKVLDINPECAEAYVAKLLVELKLNNPADLAGCKAPFSNSKNYQKAIRFASPEYRETIEGYNNAVIKRIDTARKDEVYNRGVELMKSRRYDEAVQHFQKITTYKDSTQKIDECQKLSKTEKYDETYRHALQLLKAGEFDKSAQFFKIIEDYKDSKEKIKLCAERKETARKDAIYSQALKRAFSHYATDVQLKQSIKELQTISGYKNVDDQIRALNIRLEKWYADKEKAEEEARIKAEEERRTRERQAELRRIKAEKTKKAVKKVAKISILSLIALAVLYVLIFCWIIPLIRYNTADDLLNAGKYDEAKEIYQDIYGFSESEKRIVLLTGINYIDRAKFEAGIGKILSAGVPVKITYGMDGGDFGTQSISEEVSYTYNISEDFSGIQTPEKRGCRFVKWELDAYNYQIDGVFNIKLNAVWSDQDYSITYDLNGGSVSSKNPTAYGMKDDTFTLNNPTRNGYTFIGWTGTDLDDLTMSVTILTNSVGNRRYEANWQANTYTLTFDANGGSVSPESKTVTYDASFTLPTPTKSGYTFDGWYNGYEKYTNGTWKNTSDITLTAWWKANSYSVTLDDTVYLSDKATITFNYNYSGATSTKQTLTNGRKLSYPTVPERSGYVFTGWYTTSGCTTRYDFSGTITGDMTLYAGWISQKSNAYSNTIIKPTSFTSSTDAYGISNGGTSSTSQKYIYLVANESGTHYIYYKNNSSTWSHVTYIGITNLTKGTSIKSTDICSSTSYSSVSFTCNAGDVIVINLYMYYYTGEAYFYFSGFTSPTSTATANLATTAGYQYDKSKSYTATVTYNSNFTLPVLTRTGYDFIGWYNGNTKVESGNWSIASNVTLTPRWEVATDTITFDANGGSVSVDSMVVTYNQEYTLPIPTRTGYTFAGWYDGSAKIENGKWLNESDITLTAHWIPNEYKVTFDPNGGSVTPTSMDIVFDTELVFTTPTRDGYLFVGWLLDENLYTSDRWTIAEDKTLVAKWADISFAYSLNANRKSYSVTGIGTCTDNDIIIPSSYNGLPVTTISDHAFSGCSGLTSITIPDSVTSIGRSAFRDCIGLTSIEISEGVTSIGSSAFSGCSGLKSIVIPYGVTSIKDHTFYGCSELTSVTIPEGVTSIGKYVFYDCSKLTSIVIPRGVTSIGESAFSGCSELTNMVIPDGVTSIDKNAFYNCSGLTSITLPDGVTSIGEYTFYGCSKLTSIVIPYGVTSIGNGAFHGCTELTSIEISSSVTSIGGNAFSRCTGLTSIVIPYGVTSIGSYAFEFCSGLTSIEISSSVTSIGRWALYYCDNLVSITFEGTVENWNTVGKSSWNTSKTIVYCTDGEITKNGTVTYY